MHFNPQYKLLSATVFILAFIFFSLTLGLKDVNADVCSPQTCFPQWGTEMPNTCAQACTVNGTSCLVTPKACGIYNCTSGVTSCETISTVYGWDATNGCVYDAVAKNCYVYYGKPGCCGGVAPSPTPGGGGPTPTSPPGATPTSPPGATPTSPPVPTPTPSCSSAGPAGNPTIPYSQTSYTVYAYGVANTTKVTFWVWSEVNGQDDLVGYTGINDGGGQWHATFNPQNHNSIGQFYADVWLNDGFTFFCSGAPFIRAACAPCCNGKTCGTEGCCGQSCGPNPTADVRTSATPVNMCQVYNIIWTSTNTTSCTLSGAGSGSGTSGTLAQSKNVPGAYTYNLSCVNSTCGLTAFDSVTVTVNPMTALLIVPAGNQYICNDYDVCYTTTGGPTQCTINGIVVPAGQCLYDENKWSPNTYTYNLRCTNSCGSVPATDTKSVNVVAITCTPNVIGSLNPVNMGTGYGITSTFTTNHGAVNEVDFIADPPINSVARVCNINSPAPPALCAVGEDYTYTDTTAPFGANVSIVNHNYTSSLLRVRGRMTAECAAYGFYIPCAEAILPVEIAYVDSWFQAANGSVTAKAGVTSLLPDLAYEQRFIVRNPIWENVGNLTYYYSTSRPPDLGGANNTENYNRISEKKINSNTIVSTKPEASFDLYYNTKLPGDIKTTQNVITTNTLNLTDLTNMGDPAIGTTARGYKTYYYNGTTYGNVLTFNGDLTTKDGARLIIFVDDASLLIKGNITPQTRGKSSVLIFSDMDINVDYSVGGSFSDGIPDLEGIFYADGKFDSGTDTVTMTDQNLHIRGSVVAGSFSLLRDLVQGAESNETTPGEYFSYGTEQVMAFPPFLRLRPSFWQEVNP